MSNVDIGPKKTMFILVIVVGCFAVLWPKIFYPMLVGNAQSHIKPNYLDKSSGCCDVIWENDVNAIKIMTDLCGNILQKQNEADVQIRLAFETRRLTKDIIEKCRKEVLDKCNVDIAEFLSENVKLGKTYRQILFELRSTNSSLCLKYNFGVIPEELGIPHRVTIDLQSSVRQERPSHFRPEMLHPALRERGRAIPHHTPAQVSNPPPRIVEGRPGPIPGMRPTIGGAGHVVPPPKTSTSTMGIIMPIYTIGIVIFFTYTLMKIMFKKQDGNTSIYPRIEPDPVFRKRVFNEDYNTSSEKARLANRMTKDDVSSKLVVTALSDMLAEVDQRREALARQRDEAMQRSTTEAKVVDISHKNSVESCNNTNDTTQVNRNVHANGTVNKLERGPDDKGEERTTIKVLGMEVTESCEGGKKWSVQSTPVVPPLRLSPPSTPPPPPTILLEKTVPVESRLLVSEKEEIIDDEEDYDDDTSSGPAIMLSGKVTLSVIPSEISSQESTADTKVNIKSVEKIEKEKCMEEVLDSDEEIDGNVAEIEDEMEESKYSTVSAATEALAADSDEEDEEKNKDILIDKNLSVDKTANEDGEDMEYEVEIDDNEMENMENEGQNINQKKDVILEQKEEHINNYQDKKHNESETNTVDNKEIGHDSDNNQIEEEYEIEYEEEEDEDEDGDKAVVQENKVDSENKLKIETSSNNEKIDITKENAEQMKYDNEEEIIEEYEIEVEEDEDEIESNDKQQLDSNAKKPTPNSEPEKN